MPTETEIEALIEALIARHAGFGVELCRVGGGVRFSTAPDLAAELRRAFPQPRRLPRAAMETLALIAYCQPITRPELEQLRGSVSQQTLEVLQEAGLIVAKGYKAVPGRPLLWATTTTFLTRFSLDSLDDLPPRGELLLDAQPATAGSRPDGAPFAPEPGVAL